MVLKEIPIVLEKLHWMKKEHIWPEGSRYLWTDAFGLCTLISLYKEQQNNEFLKEAEWLVGEVNRALGRKIGFRIGEAPDLDGQYYHYNMMWAYALSQLGKIKPEYHDYAVELCQQIHKPFVDPNQGVKWKMMEDLSGIYPGYGLGGLDHYHGYVVYRMIDEKALSSEIGDLKKLVDDHYKTFSCTQDLGLGMSLWFSHFFPQEEWAKTLRQRSLETLETMWNPQGYFIRDPDLPTTKFAFTNYGISLGLQAVGSKVAGEVDPRVIMLNNFFETYQSHDRYDSDAITHVMSCTSRFPGVLIQ